MARRDRSLMVRAGAGTGKTTVLVERFVRAVVEDGAPVEGILAITFTEKAAAEMKARVRRRFLELGRRDEARAAEGAWISTIHGFCSRVLRAHALSAGIDPAFRVIDELEAERVATDAFDAALGAFMGEGEDPKRLEMVAAYTPDRLRDMVRTAHARLRSRGERRPALEEAQPPVVGGERERLLAAAQAALRELGVASASASVTTALKAVERCLSILRRLPDGALAEPSELEGLSFAGRSKVLCSSVCDEYRDALAAYVALCTAQREYLDHTMLRVLLDLYGERYEEGKRRRSGLDFEDLELIARDLLAAESDRSGAARALPHGRAAGAVRRALRARPGRRVPGHQPAPERAARAAGARQPVPGRRRAAVDLRLPPRRRRGVPGPLGASRRRRARGEHHGQLPQPRRGARRDRPRLRADVGRLRAPSRGAGVPRGEAGARPVRGAARHRPEQEALGRGARHRRPVRAGHAQRHALARGGGAAAGAADRGDRGGGRLRVARRGRAAARHDAHGLLRACARGARHPHARGRRARLLVAAAGGGPAPLAERAGEPAGRAGCVQRAGVAARRAVAGRGGADRPGGPRREARPVVGAARRVRRGRRPPGRGGRARYGEYVAAKCDPRSPTSFRPPTGAGRPPSSSSSRRSAARRRRSPSRRSSTGPSPRPATTPTSCRCQPARGGWPTCAS